MKGRTIREFTFKHNIWPVLDAWAAEHNFILDEQDATRRLYRRGNRLLSAPAYLEISTVSGEVTLQAWIKADLYMVMALMTGKPPEAGIDSGGLTAWIPRMRARNAVNKLLGSLKQEPIG